MKIPFVDLVRIHGPIRNELDLVVDTLLKSSAFIQGKYVQQFENEFAQYIGVKHCIGCANGTDAIELALEVLEIGQGDEVLLPVHSWVSTASAVVRVGAKPVFIDTLQEEYTINPALLEEAITPKTKAILPVHLYGHPCNMSEIMAIARKHKLLVIEDCAQAHGAEYDGKKVGSFGDAACFSFYPSKNLGALGDGGAIVTSSNKTAENLRLVINCGQQRKNDIKLVGRNSRLDALQAGFLSVKLKYLDKWNEQRRQTADFYFELLKENKTIHLPTQAKNTKHVYHLFVIKTKNRDFLINQLEQKGIGSGIHYPFLLSQIFPSSKIFPSGIGYNQQILSLPMFAGLTLSEIENIANSINSLSFKSSF